jgi:hypothetical protein
MWFAALTSREGARWFDNFVVRLLTGAPEVYALLDTSAFAVKPPRLIRVLRYRYQFTTPEQRAESGAWWRRQYVGVWYPQARLSAEPESTGALP